MSSLAVETILEAAYPKEIVEHILRSYRHVEEHYRLESWKVSELDSGHFVESVRRLIEHQLFGVYSAFATGISAFSPGVLSKYESGSGSEEMRILIPRVLYAMYCIRNKRGVGHISSISPNKLDATFILHSAKWVLAELVRLSGTSSIDEAKNMVDLILERQVDLIWDDGETFMVLDNRLKALDKVVLVLYKQDRLSIEELQGKLEYKNKSAFKKIIAALQRDRFLAVSNVGICKLSPLGVKAAERIVNSQT